MNNKIIKNGYINYVPGLLKNKLPVILTVAAYVCFLFVLCAAPQDAHAQSVTLNLGEDAGSTTGRIVQMVLLMTVLSLAPSILVMTTSFTRIIIVFSILRHALATNTTPPNTVLLGLALFMTAFIMQPTFTKAWNDGIQPIVDEKVEVMEGLEKASVPMKEFMIKNTRDKDIELFMNLSKTEPVKNIKDTPLAVAVPSFIISELRRAFEIGFLIYIPFLIIDMVIASVLMSMGMMMLPPTMLAMPFKLIFFVMIDGWYMLAGSLIKSFGV
jgi:flagellar biosynthetic protein FliP